MRKENFTYESPMVEVTEVEVEKGFAASAGINDLIDGGTWTPDAAATNASVLDQLNSLF